MAELARAQERTEVRRSALCAAMAGLAVAAPAAAEPLRGWAHAGKVIDLPANAAPTPQRRLADVLLIQEAFARWGIAYDEARLDVIGSLFTDDGVFEVLLGSPKPIVAAKGRDAVVASVGSALAQQNDQRRHAITNILVTQNSPKRATAIAYGIVAVAGAQPTVGVTVFYIADLVKSRQVWRFKRFVIGMDSYAGTAPIMNK